MGLITTINKEKTALTALFASQSALAPYSLLFDVYGGELNAATDDTIYVNFVFPSHDRQLGTCAHVFTGTLIAHFKLSLCAKRNPNHEFYHAVFESLLKSTYTDLMTSSFTIVRGRILYSLMASKIISVSI